MNQSKKLVFFGTEDFSEASLARLAEAEWEITAVVTKPDLKKGRGQTIAEPKVKVLAEKLGIRVYQPTKLSDIYNDIKDMGASAGVLVSYGKIIPQNFIDLFPSGIINVHPSLLPVYRGPSPIEAAILNGDAKTGVSLMALTAEMDAGPVFIQQEIPLNHSETRPELYKKLASIGARLLCNHLGSMLSGVMVPVAQDDQKASYTKLLTKKDSIINWQKPADQLEREVRAFLGYPKSRTKIASKEITVLEARMATALTDGALVMACGHGFLEIKKLIAPSGRTMTGAQFLRGLRA